MSIWGAGYGGKLIEVFRPPVSSVIYDGSLGLGRDNFNIVDYGNPVTTGSQIAYNTNSIRMPNPTSGIVSIATTLPPKTLHKYMYIEVYNYSTIATTSIQMFYGSKSKAFNHLIYQSVHELMWNLEADGITTLEIPKLQLKGFDIMKWEFLDD